jgi:hypothetical protein
VFTERRKLARRTINRVARFSSDDGSLPRSCMITDISEGGARLYSETDMPPKFTLQVSSDGGDSRRDCRVVWRLDCEVGVEFTDVARR